MSASARRSASRYRCGGFVPVVGKRSSTVLRGFRNDGQRAVEGQSSRARRGFMSNALVRAGYPLGVSEARGSVDDSSSTLWEAGSFLRSRLRRRARTRAQALTRNVVED